VNSYQKAYQIAKFASEKKAHLVLVMDMSKVMDIIDYFVICSGDSDRQVKGVADSIIEEMEKRGIELGHFEGYRGGKWILLDYGDVIAHIFRDEVRDFYQLERLWRDVPIKKYD
jgi:ribosome-associated protein